MRDAPENSKKLREMEAILQLVMGLESPSGPGESSPETLEGECDASSRDPEKPPDHSAGGDYLRRALVTVLNPFAGAPFSLVDLLDVPPKDLECVRGKTLKQVFLDPGTPLEGLTLLKNLGKDLLLPHLPVKMRILGRALYFLSAASAVVHHGSRATSMTGDEFLEGVVFLEKKAGLETELARLGREAAAVLAA